MAEPGRMLPGWRNATKVKVQLRWVDRHRSGRRCGDLCLRRDGLVGHTIGIDLGTTYSAAARVNELGKPEIVVNRDGERLTPSVVLFQDELPIVGTMAKRSAVTAPLDVVQFVKRSMGDPSWKFETSGGTTYRPEEISAIILRRIKDDVELALGSPVTDAVVTVPAYFDDAPRRATIDAGRIAGLNVARVLNEPTAAALAYGVEHEVEGTVLVYDLGGGTFDVTVMRVGGGDFDVLATQGDRNLGGFDFDNLLMRLLDERFQAAGGPSLLDGAEAEADLREKAEIAKRSLTTVEQTRVVLSGGGVSKVVPLTRAEFEDATSSLISRTRDIAEIVVGDAGLDWSGVDHVLLAGGSTRMPMVRSMIEKVSGREPIRSVNPDEVVALGAAIQAHLVDLDAADAARGGTNGSATGTGDGASAEQLPVLASAVTRPRIRDVTSQGLGALAVRRGAASPEDVENVVIIPANTKIPAKRGQVFETIEDNQTRLKVEVTQGDDDDPDYVRAIGEQTFDIPPYPAGAPFEVVYAYDIDQTVFIEVHDKTSGERIGTFEVNNVATMAEGEVASATDRMRLLDIS
ncbi:molecular chaperone DnaK [Actinopolymorpha singaporensis]|uniref:Molecular chaperone DnaK n=1 Tax=Actinopolymorpha singaporensis TaxID=117157 RepID=A0A1H1VF75_9ACTN|nr:molecular chaperone DnaK [Actinopolymorpha singaporensis]